MHHLILLRHGEAEPALGRPDELRALTERGRADVRASALRVQRWLLATPDLPATLTILHSPYRRTEQSAAEFRVAIDHTDSPIDIDVAPLGVCAELTPDTAPRLAVQAVERRIDESDSSLTVVVTPQPLIAHLRAWYADGQGDLLSAAGNAAALPSAREPLMPASLCCLQSEWLGPGLATVAFEHHPYYAG